MTKMFLPIKKPFSGRLQGLGVERRSMSKFVELDEGKKEIIEVEDEQMAAVHGRSRWLPHPRSGIYCPQGHEWVMDDVPDNAASFDHTVWLRSTDELLDHKPYNN
ncbi:hypothetical protein Salat_0130600 [Sesamum alatum]|uniref:Uncharacterized protein n=1 Tax=Sesamum alatum TaxID=300844 RepID=A0AAE1YWM8_9LAMI|nr:hypothetical protein Salat_0130600 [Sesamum alatum]